jgi:16S rRNA (guanine527-N7)-methyltransferase
MEDFRALLKAEFAPFSELSDDQLSLLERHYQLLLRWNQKINLTRITDLEDAVKYHYCESLYLARSLPPVPLRIVDVGSGAGFPGIPVAVYRPDSTIDLVEAHQRKAVFLSEAVRDLGLSNVRVYAARAEDVSERYDWMISRAVDPGEVIRLSLARNVFVLGNVGEKLPWGKERFLFHVER